MNRHLAESRYAADHPEDVRSASSKALDDAGGGHGAASTHRDQGGGRVTPFQLVQGGGEQAGAGAAHRVAERDGAAVDVDLVRVGLVHAQPGQHHRGERLVDLEQVDVAQGHAAAV